MLVTNQTTQDYYFGPLDTLLVAAAAGFLGAWLEPRSRTPVLAAALAFLILAGAALLPLGVPILPPPRMARYAAALGATEAVRTNYGTTLPLPQDYADMTGWPEQVTVVASVFHSLSPDEQRRAAILGVNYGRTGAVALFGRKLGLPYPISRDGDFYFWGTDDWSTADVTIAVGGSSDSLREYWDDVREAARSRNPWGVDEKQDVPVFVCRRPRMDLPARFRELGPGWS